MSSSVVHGSMRAPIQLQLSGGGEASVDAVDGDFIRLRSSRPFPPGSPLQGQLLGGPGLLRVKVRGSRRVDDGPLPFQVQGRMVNLTREQRAFLASPSD